jgi:hypothetical protein
MAPSRLVTALLFLVLIPGLGHAQTPPEDSAGEQPWSEYPDALPPPPLTPVEEAELPAPPPPAPPEPEVPAAPPPTPVEEAPPAPRDRHPMAPSVPEYVPSPPPPRSSLSLGTEPLAVPFVRGLLEISGGFAVTAGHMVLVELATGTNCFVDSDGCFLTAALVTLASGAAAPLGASAVGAVLGGEGKLWAAYLGAAIGMGFGLVVATPTIAFDRGGVLLAVAGPIGAIVGSAIGYELSHRHARRGGFRDARAQGPGVRWMPVVGASAHGGLVGGMVGSF